MAKKEAGVGQDKTVIGLAPSDGHTRITRGENVYIHGGDEETHAKMQEAAIRLSEGLEKSGKTLRDISAREMAERMVEAREKVR